MDKKITIDKGTGKQIGKERVIEMDDLSKAKEFSSAEMVGFINLSINQYLQDYISLEIQHRVLKEIFNMLRGKEKQDEVSAKMAEVLQKQEGLLKQIRHHRMGRDEIERGALII